MSTQIQVFCYNNGNRTNIPTLLYVIQGSYCMVLGSQRDI